MAAVSALVLLVGWEGATAPPWTLGDPPAVTGIDLADSTGEVFAHRGAHSASEVDAARLPAHVREAFLAIEDRRFYAHDGIDPRGLMRAAWRNLTAGGVVEGGSTITQQYVKNAWLSHDRTLARKAKELVLADWVETWMSKDEILSRYLEHAYFGEQQTGLSAASRYYFDASPADLTLGEAAMLAGMVKAPSRLAPTVDAPAARERMRVVLAAMANAGYITQGMAKAERNPRVVSTGRGQSERAGWFADWAADRVPEDTTGTVRTTMESDLQARAERVVARARTGAAEVALIALRPDGAIAAMVGGRNWQPGAFNRVIRAERQPGSTFKLFDYLALMRKGAHPTDLVIDAPVEVGDWAPANAYGGYRGAMRLRDAFAISSNTAAVRVAQAAGNCEVVKAARDLGISAALPLDAPSLPLGTASLTLYEMAGAYAAFAAGAYPVRPYAIAGQATAPARKLDPQREWAPMLDLLWLAANQGTGKRATLEGEAGRQTFGKTGTSQDGRDALFIGFAGNLICAVWVGRDDNKPIPGASGGHLPAQIWHAFMDGLPFRALDLPPLGPGEGAPRLWGPEGADANLARYVMPAAALGAAASIPRESASERRSERGPRKGGGKRHGKHKGGRRR